MGYVSFDASVKIHQSGKYTSTKTQKTGNAGILGYLHHIDRGTDRKNGCETQHSNPDIDPDRTLENLSYYKDSSGEWKETRAPTDMEEAIKARIQYAKDHGARIYDGGKNDTVIVRPLVIQMDGDVIADHDEWAGDSIEILEDMFGTDNIIGYAIHKDETNVHMHVLFVPVWESETKDGKKKCAVSQTKFFRNPKSLAAMHKTLRKELVKKGYDVQLENKPIDEHLAGYIDKSGAWHQQGLTPDQLKQISDQQIKLKMEEISMNIRKDELTKLEQAMQGMQKAAREKMKEMEQEKEAFEVQKKMEQDQLYQMKEAVNTDREFLQVKLEALRKDQIQVQHMKQEVQSMLQQVLSASDACQKILSYDHELNKKFLSFCEREGKRTNRNVREYVEYLYKKFKKEREDNLTDWQKEMLWLREMQKQNGNNYSDNTPDIITQSQGAGYMGY